MVTAIGILGLVGLLAVILRQDPGKAQGQGDQARALRARDHAAALPGEAHGHEDVLAASEQARRQPRQSGWAAKIRMLLRSAEGSRPESGWLRNRLRTEAVSAAVGIDATLTRQLPGLGGYFLTSNRAGTGLLLGGVPDPSGGPGHFGAKLLVEASLPAQGLPAGGIGPVAYRDDDTPVQLIARPGQRGGPDELLLVDLRRGEVATRFEIPGKLAINYYQELGLAPDASAVAAPVRRPDGEVRLVVWDAGKPAPRHQFPAASCRLAFAPGGTLLAAGDEHGTVTVWSLPTGRIVAYWCVLLSPAHVRCLAFGPARLERRRAEAPQDPRIGTDSSGVQRVWPLAWSDAAGVIKVRTIAEGASPPSHTSPFDHRGETICKTDAHEVAALGFSSDGTLLASCGDDRAFLWDPATGRLLLSLRAGSELQSLAFSPQGRQIAFCSAREDGPGLTSIWSIDEGDAIRLLRGSVSRYTIAVPCPDPAVPLVAAWARESQTVTVWSGRQGILQKTLPTPVPMDTERPALAFSPDGTRLAFAGGGEADLWHLQRPGAVRSWSLDRKIPGFRAAALHNALSYSAADRLILMQIDLEQTLRIQNLLGPEPEKPLAEISDLGGNATNLAATPDGSIALVAVALAAQPGSYAVKAYDAGTGRLRWTMPLNQPPRAGRALQLTPDGSLLAVQTRGEAPVMLIDVASGEARNIMLPVPLALGPGARMWISWAGRTTDDPGGIRFCEQGRSEPLFTIPNEVVPGMPADASFTPDGRLATWVNVDNTVTACDLAALAQQLGEAGLEW
jgi:WD40 repeat protein